MNWLPVPGWEDLYEVSDHGRVRSLDRTIRVLDPCGRLADRRYRGRELKLNVLKNGYQMVSFTAPDRQREYCYVHDIVLKAFVGQKPEGQEVCHGDGNRTNNRLDNLRYDSRTNNALDRHRHGTFAICPRGEQHPHAKLTDDEVRWARAHSGQLTQRAMGEALGVSHNTVGNAVRRTAWKHVN